MERTGPPELVPGRNQSRVMRMFLRFICLEFPYRYPYTFEQLPQH